MTSAPLWIDLHTPRQDTDRARIKCCLEVPEFLNSTLIGEVYIALVMCLANAIAYSATNTLSPISRWYTASFWKLSSSKGHLCAMLGTSLRKFGMPNGAWPHPLAETVLCGALGIYECARQAKSRPLLRRHCEMLWRFVVQKSKEWDPGHHNATV